MKTTQWRTSNTRGDPLLTVLGQLRACQAAWSPKAPWDRDKAHAALLGKPTGSFLVLEDSSSTQPNLLCVSAGAEHEARVLDYHIKYTGTVLQLSESRLCFADLAQLVLHYSLTRDVLAVCLYIPPWLLSITSQNILLPSRLEPESWFCEPPDPTDHMTDPVPRAVMCSIQLTAVNGALCVINPLYLHQHGDDWLTHQPTSPQHCKPTTNDRRERRLSTSRPWHGAGLQTKRAISLEDKSFFAATGNPGLIKAHSAESAPTSPNTPTPTSVDVVLRRPSRDAASYPPRGTGGRSSLPPSIDSSDSTSTTPHSNLSTVPGGTRRHSGPLPQSPHRVSWVEDGVWPAPRSPSHSFSPLLLPHPPVGELDTLSISSIEEEQEQESTMATQSPASQLSAHRLADKVKNRLSAVGQAIGGLVSQQKRLINRVLELGDRKGGAFAEALREFVESTLKGGMDPGGPMGSEFLQEVRSSLTALREVLLDCPEIQAILDYMADTPDSEIDSVVELSLHKVALKPVSAHLYSSLQAARGRDGTLANLRGHQRVLGDQGLEDLGGSAGAGVPDAPTLERVHQRLGDMHAAYSPSKKVQALLKVCKSIYHSMSANTAPGAVFGADDFLPCVTWVLLRSDLVTVQLDTDYMMELLEPSQLQGEGGYYLTSVYASLYYISSFRPRLAARQLSVEAQISLNQWHRRRTLHCNQSRHSEHRRTLRRQLKRDGDGSETEGQRESEAASPFGAVAEEAQQQVDDDADAREPMRDHDAEDRSELPIGCPLPRQRDVVSGEDGDGKLAGSGGEERGGGGGGQLGEERS